MKRILPILILATISLPTLAIDHIYSCQSRNNLNLFKMGESREVRIEVNSKSVVVDNHSGTPNFLKKLDKIEEVSFFKSMKTNNSLETEDLAAALTSDLFKGARSGKLILMRPLNGQAVAQEYACRLEATRI
ncbi:MAG: hypothetical protein AB7I27_10575 [Bacteriovoracaceae bacterium]